MVAFALLRAQKQKLDMVVFHMLKGALKLGFRKFVIEFVYIVFFLF